MRDVEEEKKLKYTSYFVVLSLSLSFFSFCCFFAVVPLYHLLELLTERIKNEEKKDEERENVFPDGCDPPFAFTALSYYYYYSSSSLLCREAVGKCFVQLKKEEIERKSRERERERREAESERAEIKYGAKAKISCTNRVVSFVVAQRQINQDVCRSRS